MKNLSHRMVVILLSLLRNLSCEMHNLCLLLLIGVGAINFLIKIKMMRCKGLKYRGRSCFQVYKGSWENTQTENICDIFWKNKRSRWENKQNEWLCRSSCSKGSIKRRYKKFCKIHMKTCVGVSFLIRFNIGDLQVH